jgi:hypothetical protein
MGRRAGGGTVGRGQGGRSQQVIQPSAGLGGQEEGSPTGPDADRICDKLQLHLVGLKGQRGVGEVYQKPFHTPTGDGDQAEAMRLGLDDVEPCDGIEDSFQEQH